MFPSGDRRCLRPSECWADIIGLDDAVASNSSPQIYRRFALPYKQRIIAAIHETGALGRLYICGNAGHLLADNVENDVDLIDLDMMVDMGTAAETYGHRVAFCGNFDLVAVMLQRTANDVYESTMVSLQAGGPRGFSAAGCEIPVDTPQENLPAQTKALRDFRL